MNPEYPLGSRHATLYDREDNTMGRSARNLLVGKQASPICLEWDSPPRALHIALNDEVIRP